jgi:nucleotide-binding universal stress UspA family protein
VGRVYERILIVVDEGVQSRAAIDEGLKLALSQQPPAQVLFLHVLPNYSVPMVDMPLIGVEPESFKKDAERVAARALAAAGRRADTLGVTSAAALVSGIDAADCIARSAAARQCQLIVIGSHGRTALQRLIHGSVVTRLITLAPVPVLVCKKPQALDTSLGDVVIAPIRRQRPRRQKAAKPAPPATGNPETSI